MAAVIPIAIIANVFRVTVTGLLAHYASLDTAMNVFHTAGGVPVFLIAAALMLGISHSLRLAGDRNEEFAHFRTNARRRCDAAPVILGGACGRSRGPCCRSGNLFRQFPLRLDIWQGEDLRFSERIENKLNVTDYISRIYRAGSGKSVHLYVGFYSSQRHGEMIHSPKNCLPGNGWYVADRSTALLDVKPYRPFEINSYTVENGIDRQIVLYWYQQSGDRIVTNEYLGRAHLVVDSLTKNRSDAALIRVSVPFEEDSAAAIRTGIEFLRSAYPALARFLPHDIATSQS